MDSDLPIQVAETIQAAHINRSPSPTHDLNPSTAASEKVPVNVAGPDDLTDDDDVDSAVAPGEEASDGESDIPYSVVRPTRRHGQLPPMPDLRFEQSYLNSISKADTWGKVAWITARDQVMMPLIQGVVYNIFLLGWQHWNRNARVHGNTIGARARRWWYGVNNWPLPGLGGQTQTSRVSPRPTSLGFR